jgi:hypothetical protein
MIVEVAVLCIVLTREPERCGPGESVFALTSHNRELVLTCDKSANPAMVALDLESAMAKDFSLVPEVQHILVEHADDNLLVWIALDNPSREVRERVFDKEMSLIEGFPEIDFDFNLIPSLGRTSNQVSSNAKVVYSHKDKQSAE